MRIEIGEAVVAQFGAVAEEQSAPHEPGVEDATQQRGGDTGLARARAERQQDPREFFGDERADDFFKRGPRGGVLIIAQRIATLLVGRVEQLHYLGSGRWQTARGQVTLDQSVRRVKFGHRTRLGGSAGLLVVFHELVPVRGEHERNVVELADAVTLALLQAVFGRASFALGFENGERNRLTVGCEWPPQNVIRAAFRTTFAFAVNDVNWRGGFLDLDVMKEIETPVDELEKFRLKSNDLLVTEGGDWDKVGRTAICPRMHGQTKSQLQVSKYCPLMFHDGVAIICLRCADYMLRQ